MLRACQQRTSSIVGGSIPPRHDPSPRSRAQPPRNNIDEYNERRCDHEKSSRGCSPLPRRSPPHRAQSSGSETNYYENRRRREDHRDNAKSGHGGSRSPVPCRSPPRTQASRSDNDGYEHDDRHSHYKHDDAQTQPAIAVGRAESSHWAMQDTRRQGSHVVGSSHLRPDARDSRPPAAALLQATQRLGDNDQYPCVDFTSSRLQALAARLTPGRPGVFAAKRKAPDTREVTERESKRQRGAEAVPEGRIAMRFIVHKQPGEKFFARGFSQVEVHSCADQVTYVLDNKKKVWCRLPSGKTPVLAAEEDRGIYQAEIRRLGLYDSH